MKKKSILFLLFFIALLFFDMPTINAQNKREIRKLEKEIKRAKTLKILQEQKRKIETEKNAKQVELEGMLEAKITTFKSEYFSKNLKIALLPFELIGRTEYSSGASDYIDISYTPQNVLRNFFEAYSGQVGWTVIAKERTDPWLKELEKFIQGNVLAEEDIESIKDKVGADLLISGYIQSFNKGKHGSPGSYVSFNVTCYKLTTSCEMFWTGTVNSRSGAYNFDKSPIFMVKDALDILFKNLKLKIQNIK